MRNDTAEQIRQLIEHHGSLRPSQLAQFLNISTQAIHRHLLHMVQIGIIERRGTAPYTQYTMAGVPDLKGIAIWLSSSTGSQEPESKVCASRTILTGRLPHLLDFVRQGVPESELPLIIASVGEIGNNSFDHNLGQWRDVPGCWFDTQLTGGKLWILIADRGQGIRQSLSKVHSGFQSDEAALHAAYESVISGRAPEQRGNGLKFVRHTIEKTPGAGVSCFSGKGYVSYGEEGRSCAKILTNQFKEVLGTITLFLWRIS